MIGYVACHRRGTSLGWVAIKALLLYLTAIVGFRVGARRTLAEMSPFDFVAAVAVGAIVGRVPNANDTTYVAGAITLVTILVAHGVIARLRYVPSIADLVDREPAPARPQWARGGARAQACRLDDTGPARRSAPAGRLRPGRCACGDLRGARAGDRGSRLGRTGGRAFAARVSAARAGRRGVVRARWSVAP